MCMYVCVYLKRVLVFHCMYMHSHINMELFQKNQHKIYVV